MAENHIVTNSSYPSLDTRRQDEKYKIFVGGLPSDSTDSQLKSYFMCFGNIITCKTRKWKSDPSKCKGFALVIVSDRPTYDAILAAKHYWNGRSIECKKAISSKKALLQHNQQIIAQKVFVTGLNQEVTDNELHKYFSRFGPVDMAYVVQKSRKPNRIGFVSFKSLTDKRAALQVKNHRLHGNRIFVMDYQTRSELQSAEAPVSTDQIENSCPVQQHTLRKLSSREEHESDRNYRFNVAIRGSTRLIHTNTENSQQSLVPLLCTTIDQKPRSNDGSYRGIEDKQPSLVQKNGNSTFQLFGGQSSSLSNEANRIRSSCSKSINNSGSLENSLLISTEKNRLGSLSGRPASTHNSVSGETSRRNIMVRSDLSSTCDFFCCLLSSHDFRSTTQSQQI